MKNAKSIHAVLLLLLSSSMAYAASIHDKDNTYFYIDISSPGHACLLIDVEYTCVPNPVGGCLGPYNTPAEGEQLYSNQDCTTPLKRI